MTDTGYAALSTSVDKTNHILKEIEEAYGWPHDRRHQSYDSLRAVLHALRDRLTVVEAADFAAQLPMVLRGVYYDRWRPARVPVKMSREEFLDRVRANIPFEIEGGVEPLVQRVLQALGEYVTEGEWEDVRSSLPKDFATLLPV